MRGFARSADAKASRRTRCARPRVRLAFAGIASKSVGTPMIPSSAREHPYASFVHLVQKPARYLGGEFGAQRKDWGAVKARVCLAFPDIYDIGMSHLGFKILYKIFNDDERALAERCYT